MSSFFNSSLREKYNRLYDFAKPFWPGLETLSPNRKLVGVGDVLTTLYTIPLAIAGIIWLVFSTNPAIFRTHLLFLVFNFAVLILFNRLRYFTIVEIRLDRYGSTEDSFDSMIQWSAVFILGPSALWVGVIFNILDSINNWRSSFRRPNDMIIKLGVRH